MKVLITGAAGLVGRALVQTAPPHIRIKEYPRRALDIADPEAVERCIRFERPEVIVNAAVYLAADQAERESELAWATNANGPRHLAIAASETGARLVHISTAYVFDGSSSKPYRPDSPTNPISVYGASKCDGEKAVLSIHSAYSVILRTSWLYGADGHNFVQTMLKVMSSNGSVRVVSDQIGSPTSAKAFAQTIWKIIDTPQINGIHHWTDAGVASWYDFAVAVAEEASALGLISRSVTVTPITTSEHQSTAHRPRYSVLDTESIASLCPAPLHWRTRLRSVLGEIHHA